MAIKNGFECYGGQHFDSPLLECGEGEGMWFVWEICC